MSSDLAGQGILLYFFYLFVLMSKSMPREWEMAMICPILKKKDAHSGQLDKYNNTKGSREETRRYQAGFRKRTSVVNHIFVLKQIKQKCHRKGIPIHALFIHFKQAYDTVKRLEVIEVMKGLHFTDQSLKLVVITLRMLYTE